MDKSNLLESRLRHANHKIDLLKKENGLLTRRVELLERKTKILVKLVEKVYEQKAKSNGNGKSNLSEHSVIADTRISAVP